MTEQKVKNRGWVKNAAIIFLSVMLVLTFFSNTIMNRSLPEVSAQYVQSGSISTRVRGTGPIEAVETYEVKAADSRTVKSVAVKVDQQVEPGDLLFELAEGDSTELKQARSELEDLEYSYQQKLINVGESDGNGDNPTIQRAREKLEQAIADRDANAVTDNQISAAKAALATATAAYSTAVDNLTAAGGESSGSVGSYAPVQSALNAMNTAKQTYDATYLANKDAYTLLQNEAEARYASDSTYSVETYMESLAQEYKDDTGPYDDPYTKAQISAAYTAVHGAKTDYDSATAAYNSALDSYYNSFSPDTSALVKKKNDAKVIMDTAQDTYDDLTAKKTAYETAKDSVVTCQDALEDAIKQQKLDNLDLQKAQQDIADKQTEIAELNTGSGGGEIRSDVSGVVKSIGVTAGNTTTADGVMATIEVPDRGYSVSISVTADQAKKVTVGDTAEITTGYWGGSDLSARLVSIRPDPQNPATSKLLVFDITGDAESGTQVSVSIGQRSQNYDVIVPNSAVREDSNGSFVLAVVAKSSPLGNRYVATRVDVQVLAKDDTNTAVSGGVASSDYVITNSTKPIESGMQVRIADS